MSANFCSPMKLSKGDKKVVTIEDVISDCIVVSLIYQNKRFCGALMDISKRNGPYGIPQIHANDNSSKSPAINQGSSKTPFPQPLLTRKTFKLDVPQPPIRVFPKLRKGRRKVYDDAFEFTERSDCIAKPKKSSASILAVKRKAGCDWLNGRCNGKIQILSTKSEAVNKPRVLSSSLASPIKHLIPQETYSYKPSWMESASIKLFDMSSSENNLMTSNKTNKTITKISSHTEKQLLKKKVGKPKKLPVKSKIKEESQERKTIKKKRKQFPKFKDVFIGFSDTNDNSSYLNTNDQHNNGIFESSVILEQDSYTTESSEKIETDVKLKKTQSKSIISTPKVESHVIYVTKCKTVSGITFTQGDVVWSKLLGYPWWPSNIVKLIVTKTNGKCLQQEAMVSWYRCKTTSILPLDSIQLFNENFETRFEKKRKGVYKKAVEDAKKAAQKITPEVRKLISQFET